MSRLTIAFAAALCLSGLSQAQTRYDNEQLVRVHVQTPEQLKAVQQAGSIWNCHIGVGGALDVQVDAAGFAELTGAGLNPEVVVADVQAVFDAEMREIESRRLLRDITWFENFHTYAEIDTYSDGLVADFPNIVSRQSVGLSLQGREVWALRIKGTNAPANAPVLLFQGCQHAREWASPATVMYIADQLANRYGTDTRVTQLLDNAEIVIIPVSNPDGYEYSWTNERLWRKNRRNNGDGTFGVDLNRNWDEYWGESGADPFTNSDIYHGPSAFSEPETAIVRDFANAETNLIAHIDFHSFSQLILYPYGGDNIVPSEPDLSLFTSLSQAMSDEILAVGGQFYNPIPGHQLYIASGISTDWFYVDRGVYSWTFELRPATSNPGFVLPPEEIIPTGEENLAAILVMGETLTLPLRVSFPNGTPSLVDANQTTPITVRIDPGTSTLVTNGARLYTRIGSSGAFTSQVLTAQGGDLYSGTLPATPCDETVEFYVEADPASGSTATLGSTGAPFSALAQEITTILTDNAETDIGWTVSGDASDGQWDRGVPVNAGRGDPGADADGSGQAWLTDNSAASGGNSDVDNGTTYLTSPAFDLTNGATVSYAYWFNDTPGGEVNGDAFRVDISTDDGANWTNVRTVTTAAGVWRADSIEVGAETATSSTVRFRFSADDLGTQNVIEAGLDDFRILEIGCPPAVACSPADVTTTGAGSGDPGFGVPDGQITAADINYYVNLWTTQDSGADVTTTGAGSGDPGFGVPDGQVTAADLNYYVNLWVVGCP